MDGYINARTFKQTMGVTTQTLRRWADNGQIESVRTPGGHRLYKTPDKRIEDSGVSKKNFIYIRVSSSKQKDDLERQRAFMLEKFPEHQVISDTGSGINWKRKGLLSILEQATKGDVSSVVVASKDRLCRFAFELLEWFFRTFDVELVVLDNKESSQEEELSDDLLSIVQIFCCKRNGKRRYRTDKDVEDKIEPLEKTEKDP